MTLRELSRKFPGADTEILREVIAEIASRLPEGVDIPDPRIVPLSILNGQLPPSFLNSMAKLASQGDKKHLWLAYIGWDGTREIGQIIRMDFDAKNFQIRSLFRKKPIHLHMNTASFVRIHPKADIYEFCVSNFTKGEF